MQLEEIQANIKDAFENNRALEIQGSGSRAFFGRAPIGEPLEVSGNTGIVKHDPAELVITVNAGTRITDLEQALAKHNQCLPFEPPVFSGDDTVGGMVATGLSGPARPFAGSVRDYVLGAVCINGRGEKLTFGGQVMKNVAGYDASRLMVGAMGTLAVVCEVSLKVLPQPEYEVTRVFEIDEAAAIQRLSDLTQTPLPLTAACHVGGRLYLRLAGSQQGVDAGLDLLGGDDLAEGESFWASIRNQTHDYFNAAKGILWRASLAPATAPLSDQPCLLDWGGAQRWYCLDESEADVIRPNVEAAGGSFTAYRGGNREGEVNPPLNPVIWRLHQRLKKAFDPSGILNPGRLYKDL